MACCSQQNQKGIPQNSSFIESTQTEEVPKPQVRLEMQIEKKDTKVQDFQPYEEQGPDQPEGFGQDLAVVNRNMSGKSRRSEKSVKFAVPDVALNESIGSVSHGVSGNFGGDPLDDDLIDQNDNGVLNTQQTVESDQRGSMVKAAANYQIMDFPSMIVGFRKGYKESSKPKSIKSQIKEDVSIGGMTSMVYVSKTTQKIQYDIDGDQQVKIDFGIDSQVTVAHPIFKTGKFGTSKRTILAQMPIEERRQIQLGSSNLIDVQENTLVVMFNAHQHNSLCKHTENAFSGSIKYTHKDSIFQNVSDFDTIVINVFGISDNDIEANVDYYKHYAQGSHLVIWIVQDDEDQLQQWAESINKNSHFIAVKDESDVEVDEIRQALAWSKLVVKHETFPEAPVVEAQQAQEQKVKINAVKYFKAAFINQPENMNEVIKKASDNLPAFDWSKQYGEEDKNVEFGRIKQKNGEMYEGEWVGSYKQGKGVCLYLDGSKYEGLWYQNQRHGYGRYIFKNGEIIEGKWVDDQMIQGQIYLTNGNHYIGGFEGQDFHGQGVFTWTDGKKYDGQYVKGKKSGHGIFSGSNGKSYDGGWLDGQQHGTGYYTNEKGKSKTGTWEHGKRLNWLEDEVGAALMAKVRQNINADSTLTETEAIDRVINELWDTYDTDNNGSLDKQETMNLILGTLNNLKTGEEFDEDDFDELFETFDEDESGTLDKNEMTDFILQLVGKKK